MRPRIRCYDGGRATSLGRMGILEHHGYLAFHLIALLVSAMATAIDWRTGLIPNWLTFPCVLLPPLVHGAAYGLADGIHLGLIPSIMGILVCGLPSVFLFNKTHPTADGGEENVMGGGDVKLFAGLGALLGPILGILSVAYILVAAALIGIGIAARKGKLGRLFRNVGTIFANIFRSQEKKKDVLADEMLMMRLGPAIFPGALIAIVLEDWRLVTSFYG